MTAERPTEDHRLFDSEQRKDLPTDICKARKGVSASRIDAVAGPAVAGQVEGYEPISASERTVELIPKHLKA
jgi:hypothetical protein